jgi:N-acetylglucosamine-6-phosphate deacetylase
VSKATLLEHARVLTPFEELDASVLIAGGQIVQVGGEPPAELAPTRIDLARRWLTPGFIDLHVHGGGGAQFTSGSVEDCLRAARFHARQGATALLATTVAAPRAPLRAAVAAIARAARVDVGTGAAVLGCHLEGPFLSPHRCGAMNPAWMRRPDAEELRELIDAGEGYVKLLDVAPELPGALELIDFALLQGVIAGVGHSDATFRQANAAFDAGARHVIHLFNASRPFDRREPGLVGAALAREDVTCELIADGHHVHPAALRLAAKMKGCERVALVTDAVEAAGMPDGNYRLGTTPIRVVAGRAVLATGDALAGSTLTMAAAVRRAVELIGLPVRDAVRMATVTPAQVLGIEDRVGRIAPGYRADLVVLDETLEPVATIRGGDWISGS